MGEIEKEFWNSFPCGKAFQYAAMHTERERERGGGGGEREREKNTVWKSIFSR